MPTFRLCSILTVSAYTEVEADTAEEAIEIAKGRSVAEIPAYDTGLEQEEWLADSDGTPEDISVEEALIQCRAQLGEIRKLK